jgi:biotin carboxyl carrier protein
MSSKKLKLTVNNKSYEVEVGDLTDSPVTVTVNGKAYTVDYSTVEQAATSPAPVASVVASPTPAAPAPVAAGAGDVTSPMPGVIIEIFVKPGDTVKSGQEVCILEAMKMKNAIRATRDGVVAAVPVSVGQQVAYGAALVSFE